MTTDHTSTGQRARRWQCIQRIDTKCVIKVNTFLFCLFVFLCVPLSRVTMMQMCCKTSILFTVDILLSLYSPGIKACYSMCCGYTLVCLHNAWQHKGIRCQRALYSLLLTCPLHNLMTRGKLWQACHWPFLFSSLLSLTFVTPPTTPTCSYLLYLVPLVVSFIIKRQN